MNATSAVLDRLTPENAREAALSAFLAGQGAWTEEARSPGDLEVWSAHLLRLRALLAAYPFQLLEVYATAFRNFEFDPNEIPTLGRLNAYLAPHGWRAAHVIGMVPDRLYQEMLAARIFPIARHIRTLAQMDHVPVPDFLHDVFGHIPMLACPDYRALIERWARLAIDPQPGPGSDVRMSRRATLFGRFYTWAIEFGILFSQGMSHRIFGAAILSSPAEWENLNSGAVGFEPFGPAAATTPIDYDVVQPRLFTSPDLSSYLPVLEELSETSRQNWSEHAGQ